jgi:uncharacterized protein
MRKSELLDSIERIDLERGNGSKNNIDNTDRSISLNPILEAQQTVEAGKFELGQSPEFEMEDLADVDDELGELPGGYGKSRIILLPRDPQWAYTYWDITNEHKDEVRRQGGQQLALRIYDVTDINIDNQSPHSIQEYPVDEMAREWYLPIPVSDREYLIDIGYRCADGRWLILARSSSMRVPPVYPSDWIEDIFITVPWEESLVGKTFVTLVPPSQKPIAETGTESNPIYDRIFGMAQTTEAMRIAGSLYGSMQHAPLESLSSFVFPSGIGAWALPTTSGLNMSGAGMSGIGMEVPRNRQFWLVADAELIVYGATEPDATVTIGGRQIQLNPDGTFRFQMSFQDGTIDYPIVAVAADGEQQRNVQMTFNRVTPSRNTNTKEEAIPEWF